MRQQRGVARGAGEGEYQAAAHRVAHEEDGDGAGDFVAEHGGEVGEDLRRGTGVAAL